MRTFTFVSVRHGGLIDSDERECHSPLRIRAVAVVVFRKWFGREPHRSWGKDGEIGCASDRQGREILVTQRNRDLTPVALLPQFAGSLQGGAR